MIKTFLQLATGGSIGTILYCIFLIPDGLAIGFGAVTLVLCVGFQGVIQAIEGLKPKKEDKKDKKTDTS